MYQQLSNTQQQALDNQECPHCHTKGNMRQIWTRSGPSVVCDSCKTKVYRPRGRGAPRQGQGGTSDGGGSGSADIQGQASGQPASSEQQQQPCPTGCGGTMKQKTGRFGDFMGCSNYPKCSHTQPVDGKAKQQQQNAPSNQQLASAVKDKDAVKTLAEQIAQQQQQIEQLQNDLEQAKSQAPLQVTMTQPDATEEGKTVTVTNTVQSPHKLLAELVRAFKAGVRNILLVGPAGTGKSTIVQQLALALGAPFVEMLWSGGRTEGAVLGRPTPDGGFVPSPFLSTLGQFVVHNHDEFDSADPNVAVCINPLLAQGRIDIATNNGVVTYKRDADNVQTATANTWTRGADMLYCGRNQLDAATFDRFAGGVFYVDYDPALETTLAPEKELRERYWEIRGKIFEHKLRRVWGTRGLLGARKWLLAGDSVKQALLRVAVNFTPDELTKVGLA